MESKGARRVGNCITDDCLFIAGHRRVVVSEFDPHLRDIDRTRIQIGGNFTRDLRVLRDPTICTIEVLEIFLFGSSQVEVAIKIRQQRSIDTEAESLSSAEKLTARKTYDGSHLNIRCPDR